MTGPRREVWSASVLLVAGLVAVVESSKLPLGGVRAPGPGLFPLCAAVAFAVIATALLLRALAAGPGGAAGETPPRARRGSVVAVLAALVAYAFLLDIIGFVLATALLMLFLLRAIEPRSWTQAIVTAVATGGLAHLLFAVWLGVRLPRGPWGF